jgi:streptogramin lyase
MKLSQRGVGVVLTLALALVIGVAFAVDALTSPSTPGADGPPPASAQVVVHSEAASVTFDSTGGWLVDDHAGTVRHFATATGATVGRPLHLGGRLISVVSGFGDIWVADIAGSKVWEIDPKTARVVGSPIPVAEGPVSLAAGDGGVWVASLVAGTVSLIDPRTGDVVASGTLPDGAVRLAIGPDGVWVSGQTDSLTRIDPRPVDGKLQWRTVDVGQGPFGVGVGDGSVWVANVKSGSVSRVDPASMRVTATYTVGGAGGGVPSNPEMVALWHNRVWVADGQQGVVVALDPTTGQQTGSAVPVPGVIRQLVIDPGGTLWGTTANPGTVVRFGG